MVKDQDELRDVFAASLAYGPACQVPPFVRMAFPAVALPPVLRRFVHEAAEALGVPPECLATPALGTCAAAIGNTCRIRISATRTEPAVLWAVTLLESGSLKTPAYDAAIDPLVAEQKNCDARNQEEKDHYAWQKLLKRTDPDRWRKYNDGHNGTPEAPAEFDECTSKCSLSSLETLLANNPRGLALAQQDLSGLFARRRAEDEATFLDFYHARTVTLHRANGKRIYVPTAALSILGTCPTRVFRKALGVDSTDRNLGTNRLACQFILAGSQPTPPPPPQTSRAACETEPYHQLIRDLLDMTLPLDPNMRVKPTDVALLSKSEECFRTFLTEHEQQTSAIDNAALRYHYENLASVAARLALIFHLCDKVTPPRVAPPPSTEGDGVQEHHMLAGIALARWYGREATRVYANSEGKAEQEQQELLKLIRKHGGMITPRAMGRARMRWANPVVAEMALRKLERAGHGKCVTTPPGPKGGGQSFCFQLDMPTVTDTTPGNPENFEVVSIGVTDVEATASQ